MNTPDQTIELVKKWLDNPESVSKEELKKAYDAAGAAAYAAHEVAYADAAAYAARSAAYAYAFAANAAAARAAYAAYAADAKYWVNEYEELAHKDG